MCCLLVLNLGSSTLPCIRRPRPRLTPLRLSVVPPRVSEDASALECGVSSLWVLAACTGNVCRRNACVQQNLPATCACEGCWQRAQAMNAGAARACSKLAASGIECHLHRVPAYVPMAAAVIECRLVCCHRVPACVMMAAAIVECRRVRRHQVPACVPMTTTVIECRLVRSHRVPACVPMSKLAQRLLAHDELRSGGSIAPTVRLLALT